MTKSSTPWRIVSSRATSSLVGSASAALRLASRMRLTLKGSSVIACEIVIGVQMIQSGPPPWVAVPP